MGVLSELTKLYRNVNFTVLYLSILVLTTYCTAIVFSYFTINSGMLTGIKLVTAPFNSYFEGNYLGNILFAGIVLAIAEFYLKFRNKHALAIKVFWFGILATYTTSLTDIIHYGVAGAEVQSFLSLFLFS